MTACLIGRLGDLIIATPLLRALKARLPGSRLRLIVSSPWASAAELIAEVDDLLLAHPAARPDANLRLAWELRRRPCDLYVDLNPSFSRISSLIAAWTPSPLKLAFAKGKLEGLFTHRIPAAGEREHMLDRYARLAAELGAPYDPTPVLPTKPNNEKEAEEILKLAGASKGSRLLIHPGNFKKFDNRWPEEKFRELADRLHRQDRELLFMAGPGESAQTLAIIAGLKTAAVLLPETSVGTAAALMRRMDLCVMNITGTTHLAGAAGAATFGFYSGYTDAVWRLRGPRHAGLVSPDWESCRAISVMDAFAAVEGHLQHLTRV